MRYVVALALAALVAASGCLSASGKEAGEASDGPTDSGTPTSSPRGPGTSSSYGAPKNSSSPTATPPPGGGGGGNATPPQTPQKPWPDVNAATIRPGVQMTMNIGNEAFQCTSNFVFRSPDNATLYLGLAAHCVDGLKLGDPITIKGAAQKAKLAYSSWIALGLKDCAGNMPSAGCQDDFALAAIDPADRKLVHPAMLYYGGPAALADSASFSLQQKVLFYGNSGLHGGEENSNRHDGIVVSPQSGPEFRIVSVPPGVPGDSGSGVLTKDGRAAGVFVNICLAPCTGQQGVVGLKYALETAAKKGNLTAQVATWPQFEDGLLP